MLIRSIVGSSFMIVLYAFIGFNVCICTAALTISKMPKEKDKETVTIFDQNICQ